VITATWTNLRNVHNSTSIHQVCGVMILYTYYYSSDGCRKLNCRTICISLFTKTTSTPPFPVQLFLIFRACAVRHVEGVFVNCKTIMWGFRVCIHTSIWLNIAHTRSTTMQLAAVYRPTLGHSVDKLAYQYGIWDTYTHRRISNSP
jgi:hypothetical protein